MLSAIFAFIESIPIINGWITGIIGAWNAYQAAKLSADISIAAKDATAAKTTTDVKAEAAAAAKAVSEL